MPVTPKLLLLLLPLVGAIFNGDSLSQSSFAAEPRLERRGAGAAAGTADVAALEQEVALLREQVGSALVSEQHLEATNKELRHEVDGWVNVGTKVMNREAHLLDSIHQSQNTDPSTWRAAVDSSLIAPNVKPKVTLALTDESSVVSDTKSSSGLSTSLNSWKLFIMVLTMLATAAFCLLRGPAALSSLVNGQKLLEISELQVEGVPSGFGEGYLLVEPSAGSHQRTRIAEPGEDSCILRFNEVLTISMRKGEPCGVSIYRRDEVQDTRIGTATFDISQLQRSGAEASCPYFRFKVQGETLTPGPLHVAMRIRNLRTAPKAGLSTHGKSAAFSV